MRFVRDPEGRLTLDLSGKLPGRGAWLGADRSLLLTAIKKGAFNRAFKEQTSLPEGVTAEAYAEEVTAQLERRALNQLGLARRAGQCLTGFEQVKSATPKLLAYVSPGDAAADGVMKIARTLEAAGKGIHISLNVDGAALGDAIGMPGAVHLGLIPGPAAENALYELRRLCAFSGISPA